VEDQNVIQFLIHNSEDTVGVAVVDIAAGTECAGRDLSTNRNLKARAIENIPLGHKLALKDFAPMDTVIKYGCEIGTVVRPISIGQLVHIHNLKTKRWA
jgi:(2R)-sulfolactate sulfo-lyase subunit alpha